MPFNPALLSGIDGWLSSKEAQLLYDLAKRCTGKGAILEIGSWKGKSTVCLAQGVRDGVKNRIFAVDPFTGSSEHGDVYTFPEFQKNIERSGLGEFVTPIPKTSKDASVGWTEPIELLWIDGAHEYEFANLDYELWAPHLVEGGTIAFHDSTDPGVWPVLDEKLFLGNTFRHIRFIHGITYATKGKPYPLENRIMMLWRDLKYRLWKIRNDWRKRKKRN